MKIAFAEYKNPIVSEAISHCPEIEAVCFDSLEAACAAVADGSADGLVAGIDYTSREVILACRDLIGVSGKTFSASFLMSRGGETFLVADAAACKHPSLEQLFDIVLQTYETGLALLPDEPRIALLSFSTFGSGGHDETMDLMTEVLARVRAERPEIIIDGEMQLDAAINPLVAKKKAPESNVAGAANVLICPDLNSGNILYKAMEQFGGFTAAGPLLQGFKAPCSDLSRGSTVEDVVAVIKAVAKMAEARKED
ncbi:phosphate acetyltransferase [Candidatus Saccharibacteria bacterium]|nr:phosphate acetyltransferase [Candidatus Saccharibacteria bacterium]